MSTTALVASASICEKEALRLSMGLEQNLGLSDDGETAKMDIVIRFFLTRN